MSIRCRPVEIETGSQDHEGLLIFDGERLLAVLVRLSELHEEHAGDWCLEYGLAMRPSRTFDSLDHALTCIEETDQARTKSAS